MYLRKYEHTLKKTRHWWRWWAAIVRRDQHILLVFPLNERSRRCRSRIVLELLDLLVKVIVKPVLHHPGPRTQQLVLVEVDKDRRDVV